MDDIKLIQRWIDAGAEYQDHWSFIPPEKIGLPKVKNKSWPQNPIDYFILSRLNQESIEPSPEADRRVLIRRATLDLNGLPPPKRSKPFSVKRKRDPGSD